MLEHFKFKIFFLEIKLTRASSERRTVHWKVGVYSTKWASKTLEHVRISGPPPPTLISEVLKKGSFQAEYYILYTMSDKSGQPIRCKIYAKYC
jgi:hypothetical protein